MFRYLKTVRWKVALIIVLLVLQAWCDLTIPQYTSDIVDIGIQQGGIEHVAPVKMRESTFDDIMLFVSDKDGKKLADAYNVEDGYAVLREKNDSLYSELDDMLSIPVLMVEYVRESDKADMDDVRMMIDSGMMTKEELYDKAEEGIAHLGDESERIVSQMALLFVKDEYEQMGLDLNQIQMKYLLATGGKMLVVALMMTMAAIAACLLASQSAAEVSMNLRRDVFSRVVSFSAQETDKFSTASLITRTTNDIQQIQNVMVMMLRVVLYAPIIGLGGIIKVAGTKTGMGWIIGVAVGSALAIVAVLMSAAMPKFKSMQRLMDRLNLVSREMLTGISVIRAFSRERHEEKRFEDASLDLKKTQLFTNRVMIIMMPLMMFMLGVVSVLIVWNGGHGIDAGTMQVGDMIAFITYTMQIVMAFLMIAVVSITLPRAGVAAGRINEVLATEPAIRDAEGCEKYEDREWEGRIRFDDVSFRYPDANECVLENISFTAEPGEVTAVIGSTGSGKSTLINLIPRFFDVTEGKITVDDVDIRDIPQGVLRSITGYVPQKGILFSGDIESNIKFGGDYISDDDMTKAAAIAQADEFISGKEEGYKSPVAQGGTNLSGGQMQRVSIARAIARKPKILLFDDSFSALDYKTDTKLRKALSDEVRDAAIIIVAQRISTIMNADRIIVMEEGRAVGMGTHSELMKNCPTYIEIAKSQLSEEELGGDIA